MCANNCSNCSSKIQSTTRQIKSQNVSLGRDGESAYNTYVRLGGTLTEEEWATPPKDADIYIPIESKNLFSI